MQIESGKYYKNRKGEKVGPMDRGGRREWPWSGSDGFTYSDDGKFAFDFRYHKKDLIAEWVDEPSADNPKLWRDMTAEEKGALLLAAHEGKVIEVWEGKWVKRSFNVWAEGVAYRVKPDNVRETVRVDIRHSYRGYILGTGTINLINGEPDPASIRMERI